MSMMKEFREFAMRGNVVDMAVGIVLGTAFGAIVSSFVSDVLMPPIGLLVGGVDFSELAFVMKEATADAEAVTISYGLFIQAVLDFVIIAFAIFIVIRGMNRLSRKQKEAAPEEAPGPPTPTAQEKLLTEIRDLLRRE